MPSILIIVQPLLHLLSHESYEFTNKLSQLHRIEPQFFLQLISQ